MAHDYSDTNTTSSSGTTICKYCKNNLAEIFQDLLESSFSMDSDSYLFGFRLFGTHNQQDILCFVVDFYISSGRQ